MLVRRRVIWKFFLAYLVLVLLCAGGVAWFTCRAAENIAGGEAICRTAWATAGILSVIAAMVGFVVSWRIGRDITNIRRGAERFARGDLSHKIFVPGTDDLGGMADSLNRMAALLDEKIRTVTQQSHEQQAVLSSMSEGVIAVDTEERILSLNHAALTLIGANPGRVLGRRIQEVIRNTQLQRFVARTLASQEPVEADIVLPHGDDHRYLQAHATILRDAGGANIGAVVVLNDVTRLRRLENLRRDFVANVSHELKTPVTSIKGFVETLRDGAIRNSDKAEQFLTIIARQADRLNAIIDDLLKLSRIEQDAERSQIDVTPLRLRELLQSAIADCQSAADDRGVKIDLSCPPDLVERINGPLIEQAVVNLLDNAIKYSESGEAIELNARRQGEELLITVRDHGCGISAEHLPRVFERFYRVDKARSRKLGGTGLGLAIVKHIAQAHRGTVTVESAVGRGSAFTLHLPAATTDSGIKVKDAPAL